MTADANKQTMYMEEGSHETDRVSLTLTLIGLTLLDQQPQQLHCPAELKVS